MTKRLAILGGTFDPIHNGHLAIAKLVLDYLNFDHIFFVPNNVQAHRLPAVAKSIDRLTMVQLALNTLHNPRLTISTCELERAGPSYMIDTIAELCSPHPPISIEPIEPWLILGLDAFYTLPAWHHFSELIDTCNFIIVNRRTLSKSESVSESAGQENPDSWAQDYLKNNKINLNNLADFKNFTNTKYGAVILLENEYIDISSTKIRELLKTDNLMKKDIKNTLNNLLPLPVIEYILAHNLYT